MWHAGFRPQRQMAVQMAGQMAGQMAVQMTVQMAVADAGRSNAPVFLYENVPTAFGQRFPGWAVLEAAASRAAGIVVGGVAGNWRRKWLGAAEAVESI